MKRLERLLEGAFILFSIIFISGLLLSGCSSTNRKESIAVVDRGQVVVSVEASGAVEAENEVIILSPSSSVIKKIDKEPGSRVKQGDVILELDPDPVMDEIDKIKDQLDVKNNSMEKSRLSNRSTQIDLDYNVEVKKLKIASLKSELADEEQLLSVGGISPSKIEETKQNITLAEKDLATVTEKNEIRLKQLKADEEGLRLQINIQEKQLADQEALLKKMVVKAPSDGIVLAVTGRVGEKVPGDKMIVRMSDLTTFQIIGSADEKYSELIKTGNRVYALLDGKKLPGRVGNVTPVVENNKIRFNVHLEESNYPGLIPNQAIRLEVIQLLRSNTLRIPNSPEFKPDIVQSVSVKDSEKIIRKKVRFGLKGSEYQEIISGLNEGDQVIITGDAKASKDSKSELTD